MKWGKDMLKKIGYVSLFTLLLLGSYYVIYTFLPNNALRYVLLGISYAAIFLWAQSVSKKVFPKKATEK